MVNISIKKITRLDSLYIFYLRSSFLFSFVRTVVYKLLIDKFYYLIFRRTFVRFKFIILYYIKTFFIQIN